MRFSKSQYVVLIASLTIACVAGVFAVIDLPQALKGSDFMVLAEVVACSVLAWASATVALCLQPRYADVHESSGR